jgi:DNA-binding LacI/PurR family transcriptional regulator
LAQCKSEEEEMLKPEMTTATRETAFMGKQAAQRCLEVFTGSESLVQHLKCNVIISLSPGLR